MGIYEKEWNDYQNRFRSLMAWGAFNGLVKTFDKEPFQHARNLYYNNVPAVLLLLENNLVQKQCYKRAKLLSYMLHDENIEVVTANIDGLKYNPLYVGNYLVGKLKDNYAEHCFLRRKEEDGRVWIYDTSLGYKIEESLYKDIQRPQITSISKKPIKLSDIDIQRYTLVDLDENSNYIRTIINSFKDDLTPVRVEYKELIIEELDKIEKSLEKKEKEYGK